MTDISENTLVRWLDRFGPLPEILLYTLVGEKNRYPLNKILKSMTSSHALSQFSDIVSTRNEYFMDSKNVDALWVLSEMISSVNPNNINTAPYPSQLFFLRSSKKTNETKCYEIAVFYNGEEKLIRTLGLDNDTEYIFVIPSCEHIDTFMSQIVRIGLPCSRFRFAVIEYKDRKTKPTVNIYKIEDA